MSEPHRNARLPRRGSLRANAVLLLQVVALLSTFGCASASAQSPAPPRFSDPLRFVVNIPAFRLDVYENGYLTASYPVTVGQPREPTPVGQYKLKKVVWNPWWHPPFNRRPKDKVTPPGPKNPMGKVKLYFADLYYLHGTPKEHEIGTPASRGCVRLRNEDAISLAQLVHRYAVAPLPEGKLDELTGTRTWRTHNYVLQQPVPVDLVYDLVEVKDGELYVYRDLYRNARFPLPELATRALEAAGYSRDQFDAESVKAALAPAMEPGANKAVLAKKGEPPPPPELVRVPIDDLVGGGVAVAGGMSR